MTSINPNVDLPVDLHRFAASETAFDRFTSPSSTTSTSSSPSSYETRQTKTPKPCPLPTPTPTATRSYWLHSAPGVNPLANKGSTGPLTQDADIIIVGAGITGVSVAYHLARIAERDESWKGKVVVLEAREFCSGATGRNGGHLAPRSFHGFAHTQRTHGTHTALQQIALEEHTISAILKILTESGDSNLAPDVDLVSGGRFDLFFTPEEEAEARKDYVAAKAAGVDLTGIEFVGAAEMEDKYGTSYPGAHTPSHNLYPLKLVTLLFRLAHEIADKPSVKDRFSLTLHTNTPVTSITPAPPPASSHGTNEEPPTSAPLRPYLIHTPRGPISCTRVIHATNAYASHLLPMYTLSIVPTHGQVVATRAAIGYGEMPLKGWSANQDFEYWFTRPPSKERTSITEDASMEGRADEKPLIILGGGRESVTPDFEFFEADDGVINPVASRVLRKFLPAVFPGKFEEGSEPEWEWTGIMGFTKTGDPFVGPAVDPIATSSKSTGEEDNNAYVGQYISAGYTGHGMPRAFACAEALASLIHHDSLGGKRTGWVPPVWLPQHYST